MTIRDAVPTDFETINTISKELGYDPAAREISDKRLDSILQAPTHFLWVYEEDNIVKGWMHVFYAFRVASPPFLEIGGIAVSSDCQRKGVGRQLVERALKRAAAQNIKLRVRCNSKRVEAHAFYKAMGLSIAKSQYVFEDNESTI